MSHSRKQKFKQKKISQVADFFFEYNNELFYLILSTIALNASG